MSKQVAHTPEAKTTPKKMSYSSQGVLQNCEQEYWHYKVNQTKPDPDYEDSDAFGFGKAFHEVLEKSKHNAFHKEHLIEAMETHEVDASDMGPLMAMGKRYLKLHKLSGLKVIKCEFQIETREYVGYIDMIMVGADGSWWIGDLKTTSRFDEKNLPPRLAKDAQLNVYSYFAEDIARGLELDPDKFMGCRYRAITKPKIVQKGKETPEEYADRVSDSHVEVYDIEVPREFMNPKEAWDSIVISQSRSLELQAGEVPRRNYKGCINYFKPCKYFSQCHGRTFTEAGNMVKIHTISSFEGADAL